MITRILTIAGIAALTGTLMAGIGYAVTRGMGAQTVFTERTDVVVASTSVLTAGALSARWGLELCFSVMGAFKENNILWGALLSLLGLTLTTFGVLGFVDLFA
ncbi:hypothetical protein AB0E59_18900 [Lentzea sp. NPDC034063]|uniref:hypothetical protein n=1 Tax=unclassified Lentzea TaxID=2643253 RepID=UPI0033EA864B